MHVTSLNAQKIPRVGNPLSYIRDAFVSERILLKNAWSAINFDATWSTHGFIPSMFETISKSHLEVERKERTIRNDCVFNSHGRSNILNYGVNRQSSNAEKPSFLRLVPFLRAALSIYLRSFERNSIHGAEWKHQNISILISLSIPPRCSLKSTSVKRA